MNKNIVVGLGIRRRRFEKTLDVSFPIVIEVDFAVASNLFSWLDEGNEAAHFTPLSEAYVHTSKKMWVDLGVSSLALDHVAKTIVEHDETYHQTDLVAFALKADDTPIVSPEEAYFKLHLISQRIRKPHSLCLDGLFSSLNNIAWTNKGPILVDDVNIERLSYIASDSPMLVGHVDKFPYLVDYFIPTGVRIASGSQVRLGAYLGKGTTVMPAGYVNFNAGSLGAAMIEGRVSAGVVIGDKSDIGGGASIMGTLSGGNSDVISIGEHCLLGANSGTGISLGSSCTIAAGLYIYAGMKIHLLNGMREPIDLNAEKVEDGRNIVKAKEISGRDGLLFIQDSRTGKVLCMPNEKAISLNSDLHAN